MNRDDTSTARKEFDRYTAGFNAADRFVREMLRLKYEHSLRVAEEARGIASDLGWGHDDICTAECTGLLHDIGRFTQFTKYRTFLDSDSVDHGECGYEAILASDMLRCCVSDERQVVLDGVRYHNRRTCPSTLPPLNTNVLKLVRDADKIDIFFVINETVRQKKYEEFPEILLKIDINGPVSPELVEQINRCRTASYEHVKSLADMGLMRLAWVYNINFLPSLRRISERRLLDDIRQTLPADNPDCRAIMDAVDRYIEDSIKKGVLAV